MVRITSLQAYAEVLENLGKRQMEVLKSLDRIKPATNMMIAQDLHWSINRVTPRVYELRKKGLIKEDHTDLCKVTKRNAIYWRFDKK